MNVKLIKRKLIKKSLVGCVLAAAFGAVLLLLRAPHTARTYFARVFSVYLVVFVIVCGRVGMVRVCCCNRCCCRSLLDDDDDYYDLMVCSQNQGHNQ